MPDRAPILAIGDALQPDLLLEFGDVANRAVFDCAQRLGRDRSLLTLVARAQKFRRTKQAAHMFVVDASKPFSVPAKLE